MISDALLKTILNEARTADVTDDDHAYVVRVFPGDHDDYEVLATNVPVSLFTAPGLCALPEVVLHFKTLYDDEYAVHEPWLLVVHDEGARVVPLLLPTI